MTKHLVCIDCCAKVEVDQWKPPTKCPACGSETVPEKWLGKARKIAEAAGAREKVLVNSLLLRPGEVVMKKWPMKMMTKTFLDAWGDKTREQTSWFGYLVLTDRRLVFAEMVSPRNVAFRIKESIGLETLINVSVQRDWNRLYITYLAGGSSVEKMFSGLAGLDVSTVEHETERARVTRVEAFDREKAQARVQYLLDFSFLKSQLEQGGITVSSIRCPDCRASLDLPGSGSSTRCPHCGATVVAQNVFDRMKGLIGSIP